MQQYVCVRIPRMDDVNIGLFEYDRYNALYFFILNADEQIYMRYGGRDAESQDTYLNLNSLELALRKGLEVHAKYQKGEIAKREAPKALYPRDIPLLVERTFAKNNCVECHLIGDFTAQHKELDGTLDKKRDMFRSPNLKTIGVHLDVPKGLEVKEVKGAAEAAGMKAGDVITGINGTGVLTFGDLQYWYDKLDRNAKELKLTVSRTGSPVELTLALPDRWWWTDIRYRHWTIDPRTYFEARPLTEAEKKDRGLPVDGFASLVTHVDRFAEVMKSHALKVGDVVYGVDGVEKDPLANTADLYIKLYKKAGDSVKLAVLRDKQKLEMPLLTFRMSFRK